MTTTNIPVHYRTWQSEHMSGYRYSSSSVTTGSGHPTTSQAEMKDKIFQEFEGATFTVDLTAQGAPLHADQNDVQKVLDHLQDNSNVTHLTLFGDDDSTEDAPRLLPSGFGAVSESYEPLTHLLNIIVRAANSCLTGPSYLEALHFYPHDTEMRDNVDSGKPLNPNILGLLDSPTPDEPKISWKDVALFIEVKNDVGDAIKHLATYARNHLTLDRRRSLSIALHFDHKGSTLRFLCFHRSGLCGSLPLHLNREDGLRSIIEHMVGIMSIRDEAAFGLDMSRVGDVYHLNGHKYDIVRTIQLRKSVCGHSTVVYSLKRQTTGQEYPASLQSRELTCIDGAPHLPQKLVYKLSYQPESRPSEGTLFSDFLGQFGLIDIIGFHICSSEDPFGTTAHHFSNPSYWQLDEERKGTGTPELRRLHCTAMALEGLPLLGFPEKEAGIPKPAELLETILHSMIGHYNLFLGGVLHRDVSCGNILRLQEPTNRPLGRAMNLIHDMLDEDVDLSQCRGLLIDGDHAIKWREDANMSSLERSGTLPFMSAHLLMACSMRVPALHTAMDDLESFLWVLVWSLIYNFQNFITNDKAAIHYIGRLLSSRHVNDNLNKVIITKRIWRERVFGGLIHDWLETSDNFQIKIKDLERSLFAADKANDMDAKHMVLDELDGCCRAAYKEFIRAGYKHLRTIKKFSEWKDVVDFNGELLNE